MLQMLRKQLQNYKIRIRTNILTMIRVFGDWLSKLYLYLQ